MNGQWLKASCKWLSAAIILVTAHAARAEDSAAVMAVFADPPRQYASAPLWVWNDMLTEDEIVSTLRDLAGQGVKQAFVHPRPGLMTPYLSPDWFRLWKTALREAERLNMNIWIYDENSYPSGFAGGWVPELMPESRGRGLSFREVKQPDKLTSAVIGVYRLGPEDFETVTDKARSGASLPAGRYLVAEVVRARNSPWNANHPYVDLLYPGVTEKFLEVTLDAYRREIGGQFGKRIPGSFTDEPELRPAGGLPWTDHLPAEFQKRWGYSLLDNLPSLTRPVGKWKQVRHDYYQVVLEQFIDHWARPYYDYCAKHGLEFTGHYWEHEWPNASATPDSMAMSAWQQRPGIDCLMNQYQEGTHAQFGNVRMVRELSSVANQLGRARTLCEIYGAGGWDLRFEDMKRIGDWLQVLGVNTFDEHLSYVTIRGARKRDHPQSFSYHEPWWDTYHVMTAYFTRLTAAMSSGQQVNEILVLEPTTTAWMYENDKAQAAHLNEVGDRFFELLMALERAQVEYDIGCEEIIADQGRVDAKSGATARLVVGKRSYTTLVLPPFTETLGEPTMKLLEGYLKQGGRVLCCGPAPEMVDARPSDRGQKSSQGSGWKQIEPAALAETLVKSNSDAFAIRRAADDKGILFHHRRRLNDGDLVFLVNTSIEAPSSGEISAKARGVEQWICESGKTAPYVFTATDVGIKCGFELPPCGSLLLFLSNSPLKPAAAVAEKSTPVESGGPIQVRRLAPNVLTLDYVDVTAGGETVENVYFYEASRFAFQKNGMDRNPWDSAVQFKDDIVSRKFPADSGFEATYRFTLEGEVPKPLILVLERPDLYTITCNGKPVSAAKGEWWLDKAFGKIYLTGAARAGENAVTIKASPFTVHHELESAYVLGNFALRPVEKGFVIVPAKELDLTPWNTQGCPFFAAGVGYSRKFDLAQPKGRYVVSVPKWYGSVANVLVNDKLVGHLAYRPWEIDVTDALKPGANTIEVAVIGTLKNTLGPHHAGALIGSAWPASFQKAAQNGPPAGSAYHTLGYGLFEPFVLKQVGE